MATSTLTRTTITEPCPVCGQHGWCGKNNKVIICMNVKSNATAKNGGGIFKTKDYPNTPSGVKKSFPVAERKSPAGLDKTYRKLLLLLSLSGEHKERLRNRGMSEREIREGMYATLPDFAKRPEIVAQFDATEMQGVPGFGIINGEWVLAGTQNSLVIPVIDTDGNIVALRLRVFHQKVKYLWLSTGNATVFENGCSPGSPVHVARELNDFPEAWIVSGEIKANMAAVRLNRPVISIPGFSNWVSSGIDDMQLPKNLVVCFDLGSDERVEPEKEAARDLIRHLLRNGHNVHVVAQGRGLDESLVAGQVPVLKRAKKK